MKIDVKTLDNGSAGELELDDAIFAVPASVEVDGEVKDKRTALLHRVVNWQLAKRRAGTHSTLTNSEVAGRKQKPYKQKGTGRARQGSLRRNQFRGGATLFGPKPRSYEHDLPKKVRRLALCHALSSKADQGKLIVLDQAVADSHKTKDMATKLHGLGVSSALVIDGDSIDSNFVLATRNIPLIDVLPSQGANVYDILRRDTLVLTRAAVEKLQERLQ